jgi:hypothetical protein
MIFKKKSQVFPQKIGKCFVRECFSNVNWTNFAIFKELYYIFLYHNIGGKKGKKLD